MKYNKIIKAKFIKRPNRFIAHVDINGEVEKVHVKNTGRCKEILIPGADVLLEKADNPNRKTNYSLVSTYKGKTLINIDSQAPNKIVLEGIKKGLIDEVKNPDTIKPEVTYKNSRFDLYYEKNKNKGFIEIKGATLEKNGVACFPDAPTLRGTKHINEMIEAVKEGYKGYIFFLIQMKGPKSFKPNKITDPLFSKRLKHAVKNGVKVLCYDCKVEHNRVEIGTPVLDIVI